MYLTFHNADSHNLTQKLHQQKRAMALRPNLIKDAFSHRQFFSVIYDLQLYHPLQQLFNTRYMSNKSTEFRLSTYYIPQNQFVEMTKKNARNSQNLSNAIKWLRFPLIFYIILLHCYSTVIIPGNHATYFKLIYPFSLWIGETGVPGFFFISGFLFFLSQKSFKDKLKTRFHTLLIPYVLWNGILILAYITGYVLGYPQDINGKNISEYDLVDYIRMFWDRGSYDNGNFVPILCPFWYIRNLLIMSVLSPIFYYFIKHTRELFLTAIAIWWMTTYHNAFIQQTVLFFSIGAYFSIHKIDPLRHSIRFKTLFIILCIIFASGDVFTHTIYSTSNNLQIHRLALLFNIPAMLLLADYCIKKGFSSSTLSNSAFIVFATHYPIVVVLRKFCASQFANSSDLTHVLLYWTCVLIATISSIGVYIVLNKYFPKAKNILSGRR